ncbi:MAG: hypothetical protein RI973_1840, partial [Bacteroidota bacterium]
MTDKILNAGFNSLLSHTMKERIEKIILTISIVSYLAHLLVILLNNQGIIELEQKFFKNPIAAIYTPFSFILVYEVYLLIFFLSKSITIYIVKQYEIITLIEIRRIFNDIAYVELTSDWFKDKNDLQFTFDVLTSLILFYLIYLFYKKIHARSQAPAPKSEKYGLKIQRFIQLKKLLATILVPTLFLFASYTFISWIAETLGNYETGFVALKKINNIFFDEFYTILIIVDVVLLLFSFFYSDKFHTIIRNSGFVISTILIKISFLAEGILHNALIIGAVLFGYLIFVIHNLYEKNASDSE